MLLAIPLLLVAGPCGAWDTPSHQRITKAALDTLPERYLSRFGAEAGPLVEIYCMLPDRYLEMEQYGFVRKSPGPRSAAEIRVYCVRPDGLVMHGVTGGRDADTGSLVYLLERIVTNLSGDRPGEAARYAGVLAHFIEDSLSPPHAVAAEELAGMIPRSAQAGSMDIHAAIERAMPGFTLGDRTQRTLGAHLTAAAEAILDQCLSGAGQNRRDLPSMVIAACARDEQALNSYRLRAGVNAAEILADALGTVMRMSDR